MAAPTIPRPNNSALEHNCVEDTPKRDRYRFLREVPEGLRLPLMQYLRLRQREHRADELSASAIVDELRVRLHGALFGHDPDTVPAPDHRADAEALHRALIAHHGAAVSLAVAAGERGGP